MKTKIRTLGLLLFIIVGALNLTPLQVTVAFAEEKPDIGPYFDGERMDYNISYWFFAKAATGYMEFKKIQEEPLRYEAILNAETQGVAGVLTFFQRNVYRSVLEVIENGKKLRTLSFDKRVLKKGWSERGLHEFDYEKNLYIKRVFQNNHLTETIETPIPEGVVYEDALSAFYNLRYGAYGEPQKGRIFMIRTYPADGIDYFKVEVALAEEEAQKRKLRKIAHGDWLAMLTVPKELFGTREGLIEAWLSKDLVPLTLTVEDVLFFGDMRGTIIKRSFHRPPTENKK